MTKGEVPNVVMALCRSGLERYCGSIRAYWPAAGEVDATESSAVSNLAVEYQRGDCHVYATPQVRDRPREHVDFLALSRDGAWAVVIEAKRLYSSEKAKSLGDDADRLTRLRLPIQHGAPPGGPRSFVGLIASVWEKQKQYRSWWLDEDRGARPKGARKPEQWSSVAAFLAMSRVGEVDVQLEGKTPHWMLVAIRELEPGVFWRP